MSNEHGTQSNKQRYEIERMSARIREDLIRVLPKHELQNQIDKLLFVEVAGMVQRMVAEAQSARQYNASTFPTALARASSSCKLFVTLAEDMLHIEDTVATANGLVKADSVEVF